MPSIQYVRKKPNDAKLHTNRFLHYSPTLVSRKAHYDALTF